MDEQRQIEKFIKQKMADVAKMIEARTAPLERRIAQLEAQIRSIEKAS